MAKKRIEYEFADQAPGESDEEYLARIEKLIAGLEAHRAELPTITDDDILNVKAFAARFRHDIDVCKLADAEAKRTAEVAAKAKAAYELELERHMMRHAQVDMGQAMQKKKKPGFQD